MAETQIDDPAVSRRHQTFPKLTPAQLARVERVARRRKVSAGEILFEQGQQVGGFFVVLEGAIEIVRPSLAGETAVTVHHEGEFTGETNMLTGRRSLVRARVSESGEVLELDRARLQELVQTDADLSETIMRAYILRRVALIMNGLGDAILIGSRHSAGTLRIKDFFTRNGHPFQYVDVDGDKDVAALLDRFAVRIDEVPIVICRGERVLRNPSNAEVADCFGLNADLTSERPYDVVVVGAGPAGLASAVYAASEGLSVLVLEIEAPGGQAGTSSKIENYLGFPTGISGQALAGRAFAQAEKFGATIAIARTADRLDCEPGLRVLHLTDGQVVKSRTLVIASGAQYNKLPIADRERFEGNGIYYGATQVESQLCAGEPVIVVGGGNSAGQAAVFLASRAAHVHILVRGDGLAATMSRYLIRRIEDTPNITLHTRTQIDALEGGDRLERVVWRGKDGERSTHQIGHVFLMTGASPNTKWLGGCVAVDEKGFVKTGLDLTHEDLEGWPRARPPFHLETSAPGVFAVGDVRAGSIKRVAAAVGEGSTAVALIHKVLAEA